MGTSKNPSILVVLDNGKKVDKIRTSLHFLPIIFHEPRTNRLLRPRNTKDENEQIKNGVIPETLSKNPHVLAQKDCDARWTKRNDVSYFGYKDHDLVDEEYKFIRDYAVTDWDAEFGV